jgi:hypothetical protein
MVNERKAVPGNGFYKPFKNRWLWLFEGKRVYDICVQQIISISLSDNDKNFIGNGHSQFNVEWFCQQYAFLKIEYKDLEGSITKTYLLN